MKYSVEDDAEYVRQAAAELVKSGAERKDAIPDYVKYLRSPKFCTRAAIALRVSGVATRVSDSEPMDAHLADALVDALILTLAERIPVTYHQWFISGAVDAGGVGFNAIEGPRTRMVPIKIPLPNPEALKTLQEYSRSDYAYDQESWCRELAIKNRKK